MLFFSTIHSKDFGVESLAHVTKQISIWKKKYSYHAPIMCFHFDIFWRCPVKSCAFKLLIVGVIGFFGSTLNENIVYNIL